MAIGIAILITVICAFAYRLGGMGENERQERYPWVPAWVTKFKVRDCLCSLLPVLWMFFFFPRVAWYAYPIAFGAGWGFLTTYWDDIFSYDNYYMHGLMVGFSFLPFAILGGAVVVFVIRCLIMSLLMGWICHIKTTNVDVEEFSRGAIIGITLILFALPTIVSLIILGIIAGVIYADTK